ESRTRETIINILDDFLNKTSVAILIMTAEDDTADGKIRARQNVIHEAGLFQGRLGFDKVVILKQEGIEEFSNIAGLQYIAFSNGTNELCFTKRQRKFKKRGLIKSPRPPLRRDSIACRLRTPTPEVPTLRSFLSPAPRSLPTLRPFQKKPPTPPPP